MLVSSSMRPEKIIVALSGGVDSAVAAALLLEQGYNVEGVYLKFAADNISGFVSHQSCSWEDDLTVVKAIGQKLGIAVRSLNVEREYTEHVIRNFLDEYRFGRTPNPDILCNRHIKFGVLSDWAKSQGAVALATGHYARIEHRHGQPRLLAGRDPQKDQSYFLATIPRKLLGFVRFPVGQMRKDQVRQYARTLGLPNADRPDSQGLCFIGKLDVRAFLRHQIPERPGPIVTSDRTEIGQHQGLSLSTIGQRHGLGIGGGTPFYVAGKDAATRTLLVARGPHDPLLYRRRLRADGIKWLVPPFKQLLFRCAARIRYRQPLAAATVMRLGRGRIEVIFDQPQRAIAPGQTVVLYDHDLVLAGATIVDRRPSISQLAQPN